MAGARTLSKIRDEILHLVEEHETTRAEGRCFVRRESTVRYAVRAFGPAEVKNATEAVLDFWLTPGRFTEQF